MVEEIEGFEPELGLQALRDRGSLQNRKVKVPQAWTDQCVAAQVPIEARRLKLERRGIDVTVGISGYGAGSAAAGHYIRTLRLNVADSGACPVKPQPEREREA